MLRIPPPCRLAPLTSGAQDRLSSLASSARYRRGRGVSPQPTYDSVQFSHGGTLIHRNPFLCILLRPTRTTRTPPSPAGSIAVAPRGPPAQDLLTFPILRAPPSSTRAMSSHMRHASPPWTFRCSVARDTAPPFPSIVFVGLFMVYGVEAVRRELGTERLWTGSESGETV
jgi:hypothetical protein